jgi:hypothetical protein
MKMIQLVLNDERVRLQNTLNNVKTMLTDSEKMYPYACGYMESHVEHTIKTLDQILENLDVYCS